jgi:1-acyl-sn-glycerol-3-phosphate acyltransferase
MLRVDEPPPGGGLGYRLVRRLSRLLLSLFYRRLEVVGLEHVPRSGPMVVVANHHNALVDPMLLLAALPRRLVPISKAPLFRHPLIGPFLTLVGAIPVHRRAEGGTDPARNEAMFARAIAALRAGRVVLIFPEGVSQPEPAVMPLRTGAARMVLGAEGGGAARPGVTVLPVGLVYHRPATFRTGWALVLIGAPVATAGAVARAQTNLEHAVRDLTDGIASALRALIVEANDRDTLHLLHLAEAVWREESEAPPRDAATRTVWMQRGMRAYRYLRAREPERVEDFRRELARYAKDLESAHLSGRALVPTYPARVVLRYALRETLSLGLALPLALLGIAEHGLPYRLTALTVGLLHPGPDMLATYKIAVAAVLYPLCWLLEAWVAWKIGGGWVVLAFVVTLVPTGFFALAWQERVARVRREARGFLTFLLHRDLHQRLRARRRALMDELTALARVVPEAVLSGEAPP